VATEGDGTRSYGTFPYRELETTSKRNGVALREYGRGAPFVFVPGMTGGGQATLHLAIACAERAAQAGRPYRLILVDYTDEDHATLEALQETVLTLLRPAVGSERCLVWCESLGNLVGSPALLDAELNVGKRVLLSPFTRIPAGRLGLGLGLMAVSPAPLYRLAMGPMGHLMFGPAGDRPDHVFFSAVASVPVETSRRRSRWLWKRDFASAFASPRQPTPTKAWISSGDRLIQVEHETSFFGALAEERSDHALSIVEGGGHVITDSHLSEALLAELVEWTLA
jgi:pimeloyl-ACP methyl ester carboxylesterase